MSNEHERFYKTVPMVGTIPENSRGAGGTGLQPVVCGKVAAAGTDRIGGAGVVMHSVVVATQSDALHEQLLQECLVKLRDVQGTQAPKQYACNLIKRIERVLQGQSK
jgi:hypothetical protein